MADESSRFAHYVTKFGWINSFSLSEAEEEAIRRETSVEHIALERGLIDTTKLDIIRTLEGKHDPIPGYEIEDLLGVGGMGVVYRARQTALDRIVALKMISTKQLDESTIIDRFELEAKTLAQLRHPNIISAIDYGKQSGRLYFVMEYVEGNDLHKVLNHSQQKFSEYETWEIIRQAASGLAHAAQHAVVHRDIKPANLILEEISTLEGQFPYQIRIADFGLARLNNLPDEAHLTSPDVVLGSPKYMAPEQVRRQAVDSKSDVYGLGVTAWEMFAGKKPYPGLTLMEIMQEKTTVGLSPLSHMNSGLLTETYRLVNSMLKIDPKDRPTPDQLLREITDLQQTLKSNTAPPIPNEVNTEQTLLSNALVDTETIEPPPGMFGLRRAILLLLAVLAVSVGVIWRIQSTPRSAKIARTRMEAVGSDIPLFDGKLLPPAQVVSGNWIVPKTDPVIAGTDGSLRYIFMKREGPVASYRFECLLELREAQSVEVRYGIRPASTHSNSLLLNDKGLEYQTWKADRRVSKTLKQEDVEHPHALTIERQPGGWFVKFDDIKLSELPISSDELPEIQLSVKGGPAWFFDIFFTELMVATAPADNGPEP